MTTIIWNYSWLIYTCEISFLFFNIHLFREDGANSLSSILAKFALSWLPPFLFSFLATDSFLLAMICLLLLPPKKLCCTSKEPLVPKPSSYDFRRPGSVPLGLEAENPLLCILTSLFALHEVKMSEESGMHSCQTLRYFAELGIPTAPSPRKGPLASTSQFCCFEQRFLTWSVTWLESIVVVRGRRTEPGYVAFAHGTEVSSPHRACVTLTILPGLHCSNARLPAHITVTFCKIKIFKKLVDWSCLNNIV